MNNNKLFKVIGCDTVNAVDFVDAPYNQQIQKHLQFEPKTSNNQSQGLPDYQIQSLITRPKTLISTNPNFDASKTEINSSNRLSTESLVNKLYESDDALPTTSNQQASINMNTIAGRSYDNWQDRSKQCLHNINNYYNHYQAPANSTMNPVLAMKPTHVELKPISREFNSNDSDAFVQTGSALGVGFGRNNSNNNHNNISLSSSSTTSLSIATTNIINNSDVDSNNLLMRKEHETNTGFEIVWLNFTYLVEPTIYEDPRWGFINKLFHKERKVILKGLSGGLKSGQMVALMGPSGAGKTCLLECISGIRRTGISGKILLRGRKKAQLAIVPQFDNFMPQFTVEEIIAYGSRMKNSPSTNHKLIANELIEQLGLQICRSNNIRKCSGGQRKRVAIAQELVSKPNILILDEPTSGLDSSCCYQTLRVLRDVLSKSIKTNEPMAIVTTIHQPSAKVFKMFDLVYLLSKTGHTAYSGPPGELLNTIKLLTNMVCPQYSNPSDFMIELVSYDYGHEPVEIMIGHERKKAKQFVKDFEFRAGIKVDDISTIDDSGFENTKPSKKIKKKTITKNISTSSSFRSSSSRSNSVSSGSSNSSSSGINMNRKDSILSTNNSNITTSTVPLRLKTSKSDTYLTDKVCKKKIQIINTSKALIATTIKQLSVPKYEYVDYKHNVTIPLRRATSSDNSRHPFFWHTYVHIHRSFLQSIRDPILNNMRILIHIVFATLLILLFGKKSGEARGCPPILGLPTEITDPDNENMVDLADNVGYLFMCIMMITYVSLMSTVLTFPIDIKTVGKEYKNGWYGTLTYFVGKNIADLPFVILYPIVYCLITWFLTNQAQDHTWRFVSFTSLIIMNAMNSQSFGLILGALFVNSVTAATFLGPVMTIPWYLFTGFTKRIHRLAEFYRLASKFLFTRFVFEGLLDTVYGHERCNCSQFLQKYYDLRYEEAIRLGDLISVETLSSLDYYDGVDVIAPEVALNNNSSFKSSTSQWFDKTVDAASTVFAEGDELNLASLMETNVKASSLFSFGLDFEPTCPSDYKNYIVQDFRLENNAAEKSFYLTFIMLICIRILTFIIVTWKIKTRQL